MARKPKQKQTLTSEEKLLAEYARVLVRNNDLRQILISAIDSREQLPQHKQQE